MKHDQRFVAAWFAGSYGRGEQEWFSDLDLHMVVADSYTQLLCIVPSFALSKRFPDIPSSLHRVVENDPDRMAMSGADTADPVSQIDPIDPTRPLHRSVMDGESHRVALP